MGSVIVAAHLWLEVVPLARNELWAWSEVSGKLTYPPSLYQAWLGTQPGVVETFLYFLLLPLLATLPFASSLYSDHKSSYVIQLRTRVQYARYCWAKCLAVFASAALAVTLPLLLDLCLAALIVPGLRPEPTAGTFPIFESQLWSALYYAHPLAYVLLYLFVIAMWAGAIGLLALLFSYVVSNRVLVIISPFACLLFAEFALNLVPVEGASYSPLSFLRPDQPGGARLSIMVVEWCLLMLVVAGVMAWRSRVDEAL